MSILEVNRICRDLIHDAAFRAAMQSDPDTGLQSRPLTEDERAALLAGEVGRLFQMGANAFLLGHLARYGVCGLDVGKHAEKMRAVPIDELGRPLREDGQ